MDDLSHLRSLGRKAVVQKWGTKAGVIFSPDLVSHLLLAEAALLVLTQAQEEYAPAQALIRAVMAPEGSDG